MFDNTRSRLAFTDHLGLLVVALVVLAAIAAVPLASIDFNRTRPVSTYVARAPSSRLAAYEPLVLRIAPPCKREVPSTTSL